MTKRSQTKTRGYFGIGIERCKTPANLGTLWRSAVILDAAFTFQIGDRFHRQASDTLCTWKHLPHQVVPSADQFADFVPYDCVPVAVEITDDAQPLIGYEHPERAVYVLGAEDNGISKAVLNQCRDVVVLPGRFCLNVAAAATALMYDRMLKQHQTGKRTQVVIP